MQRLLHKIAMIVSALALAPNAFASRFNMPIGVTSISHDIYYLHMTIFYICCGIGFVVFGVLIWGLLHHRKSKGHQAAEFHSSLIVELIWTIIPFFILVAMAVPATKVLINMEDDSDSDINIKVTGYQWKWKYDYLDEGISFFSNLATSRDEIEGRKPKGKYYLLEVDKPVVVPIHKKVRLLVTANDVIHSWWVPELGIKRDAIPGFIHESWFRVDKPGTYRGQCAELCGVGHAYMPIVVIAKTEKDFAAWIAKERGEEIAKKSKPEDDKVWSKTELMSRGKSAYDQHCSVCHKPDGAGMPPAFPGLIGSKVTVGPVAKHLNVVVKGVKGTAMQAFGEQLSDADIAAIVTYERNSWGNDDNGKHGKAAGGLVQPKDVAAAR